MSLSQHSQKGLVMQHHPEHHPEDVPTSWRHPDEAGGTPVHHGGRRNIIIAVVIGFLALLLLITLILLAVGLSKFSNISCLETTSYYAVFTDKAAGSNADYENGLIKVISTAGYTPYKVQVSDVKTTPDVPPTTTVYGTITIEQAGNFPDEKTFQAQLQDAANKLSYQWVFLTTTENPTIACSAIPGGPTGGSSVPPQCPTPAPCPSACAPIEPVSPTRNPINPTTMSTSQTVTGTGTPGTPGTPEPPAKSACTDVIFILDESEVLREPPWDNSLTILKRYMISLIDQYTIGPSNSRFAVVGFGTTADVQVYFHESTDRDSLVEKINGIVLISEDLQRGARNTTDGFLKSAQLLRQESPRVDGVARIGVFIAIYADDQTHPDAAPSAAAELVGLVDKLYIVPITNFSYDPVFKKEIEDIQATTGGEVREFEAYTQFDGDLGDQLRESIRRDVESISTCGRGPDLTRCLADIAILVDQSTSITELQYRTYVVPFLLNITANFDIGINRSHLAMVRFCNPTDTGPIFYFNSVEQSPHAIDPYIRNSYFCTGSTSLEKALNITYFDIFNEVNGARHWSQGLLSRIAIIITDGVATDAENPDYIPAVDWLLDINVDIFAIGVGPQLTRPYLRMLTGRPDYNNVVDVDRFEDLEQKVETVTNITNCVQEITPCPYPMDVVFVVEDTWWSPDTTSEAYVKNFLVGIIQRFNFGEDSVDQQYTRVALVLYNEQTTTVFNFRDYTSLYDAIQAIQGATFTHTRSYAPIGRALQHAIDNIMTAGSGDRSAIPDTVVLVSYSSNQELYPDEARTVARQLQTYGSQIITVGVGPNRDRRLLTDLSGPYGLYMDVANFQDLSDQKSQQLANSSCLFFPQRLYPCDMASIKADIVFVVDVSNIRDPYPFTNTITDFISEYLKPYNFGPNGVQAALITYSDNANVDIYLKDYANYNDFVRKAGDTLTKVTHGRNRNIYSALDLTLNNVLIGSAGFRTDAQHLVITFVMDSFTGEQDPVPLARRIRSDRNTDTFVVSFWNQFAFYKELIEIAGDTQHVYQVPRYAEIVLPNFLPEIAWLLLCPNNCELQTQAPCECSPTPVVTITEPQPPTSTAGPTTRAPPTVAPFTTTAPPQPPPPSSSPSTAAPPPSATTAAPTTAGSTAAPTTTETPAPPTTTETPAPPTTTEPPTTGTPPSGYCFRCAADVIFLIDESSSITRINFETYVKPFMVNLTYGLQMSQDLSHLGLVHFSDTDLTDVDLYLNQFYDAEQAANVIRNLQFQAGNTALYKALWLAYTTVYTSEHGARLGEWGNDVAAYVIIITDGIATDATLSEISQYTYEMMQAHIAIYAVGVGSDANRDYLEALTHDTERVYNVSAFDELNAHLAELILNDTCCPILFATPAPTPSPVLCDYVDLMFVLDESEQIIQTHPDNFERLKEYVVNVTTHFTVNQQNTRVAIVGYGRTATVQLHFYEAKDPADLKKRISMIEFLGGARNPADGFQKALTEYTESGRVSGAEKYLIHIANYASDAGDDPVPIARQLGDMGVSIFSAAVMDFQWDSIFQEETRRIVDAGRKPLSKEYDVPDYYPGLSDSTIELDLDEILLREFYCSTPQPPTEPPVVE